MPHPPSESNASPFYRAAKERWKDSEVLVEKMRTTGSVYVAGYAVECLLKALILVSVPRDKERLILSQFRSAKAHDLRWLRKLYFEQGGASFPLRAATDFDVVSTWTTSLRYQPATIDEDDASDFLKSAKRMMEFLDQRI